MADYLSPFEGTEVDAATAKSYLNNFIYFQTTGASSPVSGNNRLESVGGVVLFEEYTTAWAAGVAGASGWQLTPIAANPGTAQTLWSNSGDSNALYFGVGKLTTSDTATGQVAYGDGSVDLTGSADFTFNDGTGVLALAGEATITRSSSTAILIVTNTSSADHPIASFVGDKATSVQLRNKDFAIYQTFNAGGGSREDFTLGRTNTAMRFIRDTDVVGGGAHVFDIVDTTDVVSWGSVFAHALASTTASTSTTTGALTVAGGVGIALDTYIGGDLVVSGLPTFGPTGNGEFNDIKIIGGTSNGRSAVHYGSNQGLESALSGYDNEINMYFVGTAGTTSAAYKFAVGRDINAVAAKSEFRLVTSLTAELDTAGGDRVASIKMSANAAPAAFVASADADAYDTYFRTQSGGAHTTNDPRGGDLVLVPGAAGAAGVGRIGRVDVLGEIRRQMLVGTLTRVGSSTTLTRTSTFVAQTTAAITTSLWASPTDGDTIQLANISGGSTTVSGNGNTIRGAASITLNPEDRITLVWDSTESDWLIFS